MRNDSPVSVLLNDEVLDTSRQVWHTSLSDNREVERLQRRRRVTVIMIGLLFLLAGAILTGSVVHDLNNRAVSLSSLEETPCANMTDSECLRVRCPVSGWRWSEGERRCETLPGYQCCTACTNQYLCFSPGEDVKCCSGQAIAPSAYKSMCHRGTL